MTGSHDIHGLNAQAWNQTGDWYREHLTQTVDVLAQGDVTLQPIELKLLSRLGPLEAWCERAVHLQCAAGFDTLSLLNLGAHEVVGIDIADELIDIARGLAARLGAAADFVVSDVLDTPEELAGTADLIFTGKGALHWMFDLRGWARTVRRLLRPGGWLVLYDFHPMMWLFAGGSASMALSGVSYFAPVISYREWPSHHMGDLDLPDGEQLLPKKLRPWPPSAVMQALLDQDLRIGAFGEYPDSVNGQWAAYPQWSDPDRRKVATTYSIMVQAPEP
jgi:SAM-dependent methyltransferase